MGGPTAVVHGFDEAYNVLYKDSKRYGGYDTHPLYVQLYKLHAANVKKYNYDLEHPGCKEILKAPPGFEPAIIRGPSETPQTPPAAPKPAPVAQSVPEAKSAPPESKAPVPAAVPVSVGVKSAAVPVPVSAPVPAPASASAPAPALVHVHVPVSVSVSAPAPEPPKTTAAPQPEMKKEPEQKKEEKKEEKKVEKKKDQTPVPVQVSQPLSETKKETEPAKSQAQPQPAEGAETKREAQESVGRSEQETAEMKSRKKCDEIFAEYLDYVAKNVKKDCYKLVIKFVFLFRECLNLSGNRVRRTKQIALGIDEKMEDEKEIDYCLANNAEQAPEISNEFVTVYLEDLKPGFGGMDQIELTQNLCHWLFMNEYTYSKLNLIQGST